MCAAFPAIQDYVHMLGYLDRLTSTTQCGDELVTIQMQLLSIKYVDLAKLTFDLLSSRYAF